jgi:hypothetical protein
MSGTGKSSVLAELAHRGHLIVDTDYGDWIDEVPSPDGGVERLWRRQIDALLDDHRDDVLFVYGCVANQAAFYARFDAVVLLSAPVVVILERVATRGDEPLRAGRGGARGDRPRPRRDRATPPCRGDGRAGHACSPGRGCRRARANRRRRRPGNWDLIDAIRKRQ